MNNGSWKKFLMDHPELQRELEDKYESKASELPAIDASDHDLARVSALTQAALLSRNDPPFLFRHGGLPAWIETDDHKIPVIRAVGRDAMRYLLARNMDWFNKKGPALPPMHVVRDLLAAPDLPFPILTRIVRAPVIAPDGSLHVEPGYNRASRCFYQPAPGLVLRPIPESPSSEDVVHALDIILELVCDFPFVSESERAHAIAFLVLPFVRDLIDGPTPLHLIEKPSPGTGASLLANVLTYPALGSDLPVMTEATSEAEWRKRITANLLTGPSVLLIDNLKLPLDSPALSAAITSRIWEDRILGVSRIARCPVRCGWLATGNNPALSNEMGRRTVRIRLDSKVERPWDRDPKTFRHPDLLAWTKEHRSDLVWAALVLARAWLAKGRPAGQVSLGMFEDWAHMIGGILRVADIPGFLGNRLELYEVSDQEGTNWAAFFNGWWDQHGNHPVGVAELFSLAGELDLGNGADRSQRTRLGQLLRRNRDRQFDELQLSAAGTRNGAQLWKLQQAEPIKERGEGATDEPSEPGEPLQRHDTPGNLPVAAEGESTQKGSRGSPGSPNREFPF